MRQTEEYFRSRNQLNT